MWCSALRCRCILVCVCVKQKTAYEMRMSDWSSDVCSSDLDHVGELDAVKILRPGRCAEGRLQPITGWRVADACAGIDIVVAKTLPDQLLNEEGLLDRKNVEEG